MPFTNYFDKQAMNYLFGVVGYVVPHYFFALSTTTPDQTGASFTEPPSINGYARYSYNNSPSSWNVVSVSNGWAISNALSVTFPVVTAPWGTIVYFGVYDLASGAPGANLLMYGTLTAPVLITTGQPYFPPSTLIIANN